MDCYIGTVRVPLARVEHNDRGVRQTQYILNIFRILQMETYFRVPNNNMR